MIDRQAIASLRRHIRDLADRSVGAAPGKRLWSLPRTPAGRPVALAVSVVAAVTALASGGDVAPQQSATTRTDAVRPIEVADRGGERAARSEHRRRLGTVPPPNAVTRGKPRPKPAWVKPTTGYDLSSGYGPRWGTLHAGIDLAGPTGTPIRAAHSGTVERATWYGGYGYAVIINHGNGVSTLYGHNSQLLVQQGQRVGTGQRIALMGSTGDSTGSHLHFEIHLGEEPVDPMPWLLRRHGVTL
ncbi:MAG: M23 family metallopeptidase [Micromonosporaceae bacterium]